jgi:hypothetical protein
MSSTPELKDNWYRFNGDSTEPEWDIESDVDEVDFDEMDDKNEY